MATAPGDAGGARLIRAAAERIVGHVVSEDEWEISYRLDLALESLIALSAITGEDRWLAHADSVARRRGWDSGVRVPWRKEPFACLSYALARAHGDERAMAAFVAESRDELAIIWRSDDGLMLHSRGESRGGGYAVLIDSFAEYVGRMARAGAVSGEAAFFRECGEQVERHRDLLRNPASGLWSQGRGWLADRAQLSPGAWSRGHGWLMRGFVNALEVLPADSVAYTITQSAVRELADALIPLQDPSGLWHALLHRPLDQSPIETSGTGLIAGALFRGVAGGHLPARPYLDAAWRATEKLLNHVDENGIVHDACPGPGPLEEEAPWLINKFPPDDHHGPGTVLHALTGALRARC